MRRSIAPASIGRDRGRGSYVSASVGTAILVWGADEHLIDDPFGKMADAKSQVVRDGVWEWYNGTVYNRLHPPLQNRS
jgi:hypothetical protein